MSKVGDIALVAAEDVERITGGQISFEKAMSYILETGNTSIDDIIDAFR